MSENALIWLFALIASAIVGLYGLFIWHIRYANDLKVQLTEVVGKLNTLSVETTLKLTMIDREIGSHESGLRGSIHKLREETRKAVVRIDKRIISVQGKVGAKDADDDDDDDDSKS